MSFTTSVTLPLLGKLRSFVYSISRFTATAVNLRETQIAELRTRRRTENPLTLAGFEHQVFSQNGEDGSIREIFRRIGPGQRVFVEIGVGRGIENNTALLLREGWSGVWLDGSKANCAFIREHFAEQIASRQLVLIESFVTAENVLELLNPALSGREVDLLSVDVDRNTYYVWEALAPLRARASVIEYNAIFPADMRWIVEYDPNKWWKGTSHFGASLASLADLGEQMGHKLVGCDLTGTNAFFVRSDQVGERFAQPYTAEHHYEPVRYHLQPIKSGHPRAFRD
ncbi:hypothetical protein FHW69_000017 [Luteibacter sp. Sphag1AF]|uniref:hypothetical protein n=1 Tax=Luteibacter sp. Sphag1AF TaxID=2587031 RepID=UPI00161974AB|nr:hypothetical protein [Luteibacter sp. Sphag1AF]MBB3225427.1 hypothetical protein [Luteibacter sp. Sphag1AF]